MLSALAIASIQVVSFNIRLGVANDGPNSWQFRKEALFEQVRTLDPDILGLQEAMQMQIDDFRVFAPAYEVFGVGREDGVEKGERSCILYRRARFGLIQGGTFWLSDRPDEIGSMTWGNRITRICTYGLFQDKETNKQFWVFNCHLDHESQPSREKSVQLILSRIKAASPAAPVILIGDFNSGEDNPAARAVTSSGLIDTFRKLHPDQTDVGTFTAFDKPGKDKIDHIFVSSDWTVDSAEIRTEKVQGRLTSDHYPVTARIRFL
jgi:endonuclease/exonuclease/phosphatase family metal-dependent hydrolase